jgi:hypothetical protein
MQMAEIEAQLYLAFVQAREFAKAAKAQQDELAAEIKAAAGDDPELTVNGKKVGGYDWIDKFPAQRFIKDHPELAEQFMVIRAEQVLDEALLRRTLPDLYRNYQTRQLSIEG